MEKSYHLSYLQFLKLYFFDTISYHTQSLFEGLVAGLLQREEEKFILLNVQSVLTLQQVERL